MTSRSHLSAENGNAEPSVSGGFFWFDPFGNAPADADVSGRAGGPISWGGSPSWPFERDEPRYFSPFSSIIAPLFRRRWQEPHFQFRTDLDPDAPPSPEPAIIWERKYVITYSTGGASA